jgi:SAM-dependent methyltransferase
MAKATFEFGANGTRPPESDGRLDAPAFHRNHEPIWSAIADFLNAKEDQTPARGDQGTNDGPKHVLEIGSGTGQHIADYARRAPNLTFWPSDIIDSHLASIRAWRRASGLSNLREPQRLDLIDANWRWSGDNTSETLAAILCFNVIHISQWRVTENLMRGAGRMLHQGGYLLTYGPYKRDGVHTAPSNESFDASLRARDPEWGVRDVADVTALARENGLIGVKTIEMPANNLVLAFQRR